MSKTVVKTKDVEAVGRLQCTRREAAAFLDIRVKQFDNLLRSNEAVRKAFERGKQLGKLSLRRKQLRLAGVNATMAIFLGKNILGQQDKSSVELTGEDGGPIEFDAASLNAEERNDLRRILTKSGRRSEDSR